MKAMNLRCEYLYQPMGIDMKTPRLFWNCVDGVEQTAYEILAEDEDGKELWATGKVSSCKMTHIPYEGKPLDSRTHVNWKVRLWDEMDQPGEWSDTAFFEMGLLYASDWKASWITGDYKVNKKLRYPVDYFRKSMVIDTAQVKKARLYVSACGLYRGDINGKRIGDFVLAPGLTDYRKRIQYQVYDVTQELQDGENHLDFMLADGWYRGSVGAWGMRNYYGSETKLIAQLELTNQDGSIQCICTDNSFQWSNDGAITFADNKDGEIVDARKLPSYQGQAKVTSNPITPTASNNVAIKEHETFSPKVIHTPAGKMVLDFGQNIAGYLAFKLRGTAGEKLHLRFGEMLDSQGEFSQKNIQCSNKKKTTPLQEIYYICKDEENNYKTNFAIFGFQYVLVEGDQSLLEQLQPEDFTAIAVYSDMKQTTSFDSSNVLLNQLVLSTLWSARNNSADIPTDCPTRERHGWTGDAQIFFNTAGYLLDYAAFARKYERDLTDWQAADKKGRFPQIAPEGGTDPYMAPMNGSVGWADAGVMIPYRFWKLFGDDNIIRDNYEAMKKYGKFMISRCGKRGITAKSLKFTGEAKKYAVNAGQAYGEWAEPSDVYQTTWKDCSVPHPEVSTAYTSYVMSLLEEIATYLGKTEDAAEFARIKEKTRYAYQEMMKLPEFSLDTDRQANLVRPLYFGLLDEKQTAFARKRLLRAMENYHWRIGTGFLSTPLILHVLSTIDLEAAYRLLENEEMPGWLFMPKTGANTIWEGWEGTAAADGIASLNHYSKGACCEWVFQEMCGIHVEGENHFVIAPMPGGHFTYATTSYDSVYGKVTSGWKKENDQYHYRIEIPANTTAEIRLPDGSVHMVKAGSYQF